MLTEALQYIASLVHAAASPVVVGDQFYAATQLHLIEPPLPKPLILSSLQAVADYVNDFMAGDVDLAKDGYNSVAVHVIDPQSVSVVTNLNYCNRRRVLADAEANINQFGCERATIEDLIVEVTTHFEDNYDRARLLAIVGAIRGEEIRSDNDDGITQTVTVRKGIATVAEQSIKNPFYLAPYRTFQEVPQPESPFILRLKSGQSGPQVSLFQVHDNKWRNEAVARIKAWLEQHIQVEVHVIG